MKGKYDITYLDTSCWEGISLDATHYYGKLWNGNEIVQVEKKLTQEEADKLNKKDGVRCYKQDSVTERFEKEEDIIRFSKEVYKRRFPKSKILLLGSPCSIQPRVVLDCPKGFDSAKAMQIYLEAEKLDFYANSKNDAKMDKLMEQWKELFE